MENLIERVQSILDEIEGRGGVGAQVALAHAAEASKSVVNQWLAGRIKSMDIRYALAIERNLGYNHIWLMIGAGARKVADTSDRSATEKESQIAPIAATTEVMLPKTESPVNAGVLAGIGFITEEEARVLNLFRMATQRGQILIEAAASGAPKRNLTAVERDQAKFGLSGEGDSHSN
ncbi:hypothetical protein [Duganella sp. LjRoot269]|uniref:hypothetical protein n=1 Tax=Duganella sp. LjRoot269 TaxID=3342305 RepID=UPI003ED0AA92